MIRYRLMWPLFVVCSMAPAISAVAVAATGSAIPDISRQVDSRIDRALAEAGVVAAPEAGEANLIRRLMLDLAGRIPTTAEVQAYTASKAPDKRVQLIDRLLGSGEFLAHQENEFDTLLMYGTSGNLRQYLSAALKQRRGWDRIFRELVAARGDTADTKGSDEFLKARAKDTDRLTNDVSMLFFGVNISCTQCHDHPLVDEWKQDHFYGLKSFFNRTFLNGTFLAERDYGLVTYKTPSGQERTARLMFLSGVRPSEPAAAEPSNEQKKQESKQLKEWADKKLAPPPPKFSRRSLLVDAALRTDQNRFFARSIVNRLWYRLMGYGLVMPLDQLQAENTASHPELLDWLSQDLVDHGYDLTRTMRGLVLSKTYARSSRWRQGERPDPSLFAVAQVRPLSPMQLAASLRIAAADPATLAAATRPADIARRIESLVSGARGLARLFDMPQDNFQIGATEPLLFSNGAPIANELLADGGDRLIGRLKQLRSPREQVDTAYWAVLSRQPNNDECALAADYLGQRSSRPIDGLQQVVWALMSSAEFRFNY